MKKGMMAVVKDSRWRSLPPTPVVLAKERPLGSLDGEEEVDVS